MPGTAIFYAIVKPNGPDNGVGVSYIDDGKRPKLYRIERSGRSAR